MSLSGRQKQALAGAHNARYEREKQRPPVRALFRYLWWLTNHDAAMKRAARKKQAKMFIPLMAGIAANVGTVGHIDHGGESDNG